MTRPSRIAQRLERVADSGEKAMGIFMTSGFPRPSATLEILRAIDDGGADFIELGMPFSDPLAEGIPIQRASETALANGASMRTTLAAAAEFRSGSDTPLLLMGYLNPVIRFGVSNFFDAAASSGVDGVILPDLPPAEKALVSGPAAAAGVDLIFLIAPNTPDPRIQQVDDLSSGFVYAVSVTGLTGTGLAATGAVNEYLRRARKLVTRNRLLVGFGISSHADAERLSEHTDGFIVGSALISLVETLFADSGLDGRSRLEQISSFVRGLKSG
jgi:tryptophan synthase alpha chain